jgi:phthiocerol/phenolphthiocerol synthesis type-I polyketide synthase C
MQARAQTQAPDRPLAVVGMAGRFPGAADIEAFWRLLRDRGEAIGPVPAGRWDAAAQLDPEKSVPAVGGFLDQVDQFDAGFFGISPREAEAVDPQQRLLLELSWQALEDAGTPAASLAGSRTGVYVGASWHDYELLRKERGAPVTQHSSVGNAMDVIAARVSYFLKLTGPSLTVETGCSSALVALHLAAQALRHGEIDAALVGGVSLMISSDPMVGLTHFGGLSPEGRCSAFGASADGFARGEGCAALYLKTLERALADGDRVRAVIVGTAVNNDGGGESLVTPNPAGQEDLLRRIYATAGVPADDVAYVEAHGTGTKRGDPVEAGVIGRVLGQRRGADRGPLPIGSVKTNVGHLEAAAAMAGLFKVILALGHGVVPPSLHADEPNPEIDFGELNLCVAREPLDLPADRPVFLGVNSFGWGGTNAHVLVTRPAPGQEAPADGAGSAGPVLVALSAHSGEALKERARQVAAVLERPGVSLGAVAGTLAWQRDHFPPRVAVVADSATDAAARLNRFAAGEEGVAGLVTGRAGARGRTAFVFPGQGSQWAAMGRDLLAADPVFGRVIDRCDAALSPHVDWSLSDVLSGKAGEAWTTRIDVLQPTLWAASVALAEVWRAAGVEPDVVVGHSQGEVTAATVAGILSYEDAALVIARRSAVARRLSGRGHMLAVDLDVDAARAALAGFEDSVSLAVHNGPSSCVLSGDADAVLVLKELMEAEGTFCRLVNVDYASHSPQVDQLRDDLLAALAPVRPRAGAVPLMSTVRLSTLRGPEMDVHYWVENLRQPVMFADAMSALFDDGVTHVVEISPHPVLTPALERLTATLPEPPAVLSTLRRDAGGPRDLAHALAHGYVRGLEPFGRLARRPWAPLPTYPWQRRRYWPEPGRRTRRDAGLEVTLTPAVAEPDAWTASLELSTAGVPWLRDHRVADATVVPGALMLELALRTARARAGAAPRTLADVVFRGDLTLGDDPAELAVRWRDDVTEGGSFVLSSLAPGAKTWTEHARARVLYRPAAPPATAGHFPAHLLAEAGMGAADFYAACSARGLEYGPAFQGVLEVRAGDGEALGEVRLSDTCRAGRTHLLHPALWDGALQVVLALLPGTDPAVPTAVHRVHLHRDLDGPVTQVWSHAVRRDEGCFDVVVFDAGRTPLMTIEGLRLEALAVTGDTSVADRMHRLVFTEPPAPPGVAAVVASTESWLVCAGSGQAGEARELAGALRAHAVAAVALAERSWDDGLPDGAWNGVVFLAPSAREGLDAQRQGLVELTGLVRACVSGPVPPRVAVVTRDAQAVSPGAALDPDAAIDRDGAIDPGAAMYWGYVRVLRREHPECSPVLVDLASADPGATDPADPGAADPADPGAADPADPGWPAACAAELLGGDDEDQVVLRPGRRLAGRLTRGEAIEPDGSGPPWRTPRQPFRLAPDRPGLWEGLVWHPLWRRPPGPGEIEVAVEATALNFIDVMKAVGIYPDAAAGADRLGGECVGRVTALGSGVSGVEPGDRVVACGFGMLASHVVARADHARPVPDAMDGAEAAALPLVAATAWYALHDLARLTAGETVLVHSAAGGLGLAAVQVARLLGAEVVATAGSERKREHLRGLGIRHVFDSRDLSWADEVRAATSGRGVDVVLNSLTGAAIELGLDALAEDGRFIEVGKKDIFAGRPIGLAPFRKGISLAAVDLAGLMARRPERFAMLLAEVWDRVVAGEFRPLPVNRYPFADAVEALRCMSRGSHIGKFVVTDPATAPAVAPEPLAGGRLRPDATYLITGGLGALGLSLAGHLADRGAGTVALLGRSAPTAEAAGQIAALRDAGTRVEVVAADVADPGALDRALTWVRAQLPPLRGVVHAAGLLDDATILTMRPGQLERVLAPKVDGARNLDRCTTRDPLDFFVMFSSAAALFGNAGQAAYAAGNAYLDALAVSRRRRGLPGLSVQWGPFEQIGLAARDEGRGARLAERGMTGFTAAQAWRALDHFLGQDRQVVGYAPIDLRRWFDAYPDTAALKSWSELREAARGGSGHAADDAFVARLRGAMDADRGEMLESKVRELAGRVMRLDPAAIENDMPFKALGLDSLMSLELRNRLEAALGLRLSPTLLWTYGSIRALSGKLSEQLLSDAGPEAVAR